MHFKHIHHHFNRALYVYHCPSCELFCSMYRYYCAHGCVCQLDIKENGGGGGVVVMLFMTE